MRQAIITHFIGPTNFRGPRVSAKADAGRIVVNWNYALSVEANHRAAAEALANKLGWNGGWIGGGLPGDGFVFVNIDGNQDGFFVGEPG